jgi:alkylation response protein AidB-like acyl-CoA dehydrogenase
VQLHKQRIGCAGHPWQAKRLTVYKIFTMSFLQTWLHAHADTLDTSASHAEEVLPMLVRSGLPQIGVPTTNGGDGGDTRDAILAISAVAEQSLTAAFVLWGHRTFIELLLQSPNVPLRERLLPQLLSGTVAGATGLSNVMKFLSGMEALRVMATPAENGCRLNGSLAWASNLRKAGFVVAAAVASTDSKPAAVVALNSQANGIERTPDLDLLGLRGSNTATVKIEDVFVSPADIISNDAQHWLPTVRPAFLGMQCGLSIGLARASLRHAAAVSMSNRNQMAKQIESLEAILESNVSQLLDGVGTGLFHTEIRSLFRLRLALAGIVQQALMLELQALGGNAYLNNTQTGFARRWREAAFIPILTPSVTQLQAALGLHG